MDMVSSGAKLNERMNEALIFPRHSEKGTNEAKRLQTAYKAI